MLFFSYYTHSKHIPTNAHIHRQLHTDIAIHKYTFTLTHSHMHMYTCFYFSKQAALSQGRERHALVIGWDQPAQLLYAICTAPFTHAETTTVLFRSINVISNVPIETISHNFYEHHLLHAPKSIQLAMCTDKKVCGGIMLSGAIGQMHLRLTAAPAPVEKPKRKRAAKQHDNKKKKNKIAQLAPAPVSPQANLRTPSA